MDAHAHAIEIAMRRGDASWCRCTCGWLSGETTEDESAALFAAHVAAAALAEANGTTDL